MPYDVQEMKYHRPGWEIEPRMTCATCGAECYGADDQWICPDCGDEYALADDHDPATYMVWGPGEIEHDGHLTGRHRDRWAACWISNGGQDTDDFRRGDSLDAVLAIFPDEVAARFRVVVTPTGN